MVRSHSFWTIVRAPTLPVLVNMIKNFVFLAKSAYMRECVAMISPCFGRVVCDSPTDTTTGRLGTVPHLPAKAAFSNCKPDCCGPRTSRRTASRRTAPSFNLPLPPAELPGPCPTSRASLPRHLRPDGLLSGQTIHHSVQGGQAIGSPSVSKQCSSSSDQRSKHPAQQLPVIALPSALLS